VTKGIRPKKPSFSRGFAHETRRARGSRGLKTAFVREGGREGRGGREGMSVSARTRPVRADAGVRPYGRECFTPR
jgi:hypothetical protein